MWPKATRSQKKAKSMIALTNIGAWRASCGQHPHLAGSLHVINKAPDGLEEPEYFAHAGRCDLVIANTKNIDLRYLSSKTIYWDNHTWIVRIVRDTSIMHPVNGRLPDDSTDEVFDISIMRLPKTFKEIEDPDAIDIENIVTAIWQHRKQFKLHHRLEKLLGKIRARAARCTKYNGYLRPSLRPSLRPKMPRQTAS